MKKNKLMYILAILHYSAILFAQESLTLEQALSIAIQNNYSIRISLDEQRIAQNNFSKGNAGMLPSVTFFADGSYSGNDTRQEFVTGNTVDKKAAQSNTIGSGIEVNWILFDGKKMFIAYDRLKELNQMAVIASRQEIENITLNIMTAYYDIIRQKQLLILNDTLSKIYEEHLQIARTKWENGRAAKTEYLQAKIDLNTQANTRIGLLSQLDALKISLNKLMARNPESSFDVSGTFEVNTEIKLEESNRLAMQLNTTLLWQKSNVAVSQFNLRESKATRYPEVSLNAAYNFSRNNNQAGFLLYNQNLGWNAGIGLQWNLYDGNRITREIENAKISLQVAQLQLENAVEEVQSAIHSSFKIYTAALDALKINEETAQLAKENLDITLESFRLGKATSLEFREAQRNYEDAASNSLQSLYDAKKAETELLKLKGELVR